MPKNTTPSEETAHQASKTKKPSRNSGASASKNKASSSQSFEQKAKATSKKAEDNLQKTAAKLEAGIDRIAETVSKKVREKIDPELEQKTQDLADRIEQVADTIEDTVQDIAGFIPDPQKIHSHAGITIKALYVENVSRLFIFRFLWLIIQIPIIYIRSLRILIINIINWIHMLILGTRNKTLRGKTYRFLSHTTKRNAYISGFTDEQPKILEDKPE